MKFLRPLTGPSRRDHLYNDIIRKKMRQTNTVKAIDKYADSNEEIIRKELKIQEFPRGCFIIRPEITSGKMVQTVLNIGRSPNDLILGKLKCVKFYFSFN
jgi:hypothetical protein